MYCLQQAQQPWLPRRSSGRSSQVAAGCAGLPTAAGCCAGRSRWCNASRLALTQRPFNICLSAWPLPRLCVGAGRALVGLGVGLASVTVPVYSEWLHCWGRQGCALPGCARVELASGAVCPLPGSCCHSVAATAVLHLSLMPPYCHLVFAVCSCRVRPACTACQPGDCQRLGHVREKEERLPA